MNMTTLKKFNFAWVFVCIGLGILNLVLAIMGFANGSWIAWLNLGCVALMAWCATANYNTYKRLKFLGY